MFAGIAHQVNKRVKQQTLLGQGCFVIAQRHPREQLAPGMITQGYFMARHRCFSTHNRRFSSPVLKETLQRSCLCVETETTCGPTTPVRYRAEHAFTTTIDSETEYVSAVTFRRRPLRPFAS